MADNTTGDIRSIIKNSTQGWLINNQWWIQSRGLWVMWAGNTIATKEEIEEKRWNDKMEEKVKVTKVKRPSSKLNVSEWVSKPTSNSRGDVSQPNADMWYKKTEWDNWSVFASQNTNPNQINQWGTQINSVEINGQKPQSNIPSKGNLIVPNNNVNSKIPWVAEQAKLNINLDKWRGVRDLYTTMYASYQNGQYLTTDVLREKFPEFNDMSDDEFYNFASDVATVASQWNYDLQNALWLADLYNIDYNLMFDDLDANSKMAAMTYLSQKNKGERHPWLFDHVVNFAIGQWAIDDNEATLEDFLTDFTDATSKAKISDKDFKNAEYVDLENIFNNYRPYYKVKPWVRIDEIFNKYKNYEKPKTEWDWGNPRWMITSVMEVGWPWDIYQELMDAVEWNEDVKWWNGGRAWGNEGEIQSKKEEFHQKYKDWYINKDIKKPLNEVKNATYNLLDLAVWAYHMGNHPIDTAQMLGWMAFWTVGNAWANIWLWSDEKWDKVMNSDIMNSIKNSNVVGEWFANMMQWWKDTASFIWDDYIIPTYWTPEDFKQALSDRPFDVWSDMMTAWELSLKLWAKIWWGDLGEKVQVWFKNWKPIYKTKWWLKWEQVAKLDPMVWFGWATTKLWWVVIWTPFKIGWGIAKGVWKWAYNLIDSLATKTTWLNKEQRQFIRENPTLVQSFIKWEMTADDIANAMKEKYGETRAEKMLQGDVFKFLENTDQKIDTRWMYYKLDEVFKELWVVRWADWVIKFTKPIEDSVKARILKAYEYMDSISNGSASVRDVHWAREGIGGLTKWDAGHAMTPQEAKLNAAMKDVYGTVGETLKQQVKWWAEADKAYTEIMNVLNDFKERFDKDGNLKDSAYSKISNLMNKNNKPKLERLLKYFPEFEKDLKALATAKAVERATQATAGQYLNALSTGIWWAALFSLFSGHIWLAKLAKVILASSFLTPKNFVRVLSAEWSVRRALGKGWEVILKKLKRGVALTQKEADALYEGMKDKVEDLKKTTKDLTEKWELEKKWTKKENLKALKEEKQKLEEQLKNGEITKEEFDKKMDDIDYDTAIWKSEANKWDKEYRLSEEEWSRVWAKYWEKAENLGFTAKVEQDMTKESKEAWREVYGYTDVKNKLYALSKNPTSTTAQHEFFHAVMNVVDAKTRKYILNEARKILKEAWMSDANVEERLAESFGRYAKRWDVKLWILERRKGIEWIKDRIGEFFQKVYEWIQNYNGDRRTINKMFNEILKDDLKLDAEWKLDLSYLLNEKNPWWLKGKIKNKLWLDVKFERRSLGGKEWWVKFKKDVNSKKPKDNWWAESWLPKVRYKKDINWKSVQIDTKATSPDQLIEKNADWLSVMKAFISDKQAEKALNVSKDLLTKDGDAYLWTHTNKYDNPQFAAFENMKDSKYKEFVDNEIAFFSNSEEMSKSYAKGQSKLANTKPYKNVEDFNKNNLTVEKSTSKQKTRSWVEIPTKVEITKWNRIIEGKSWKARVENVIENKRTLDTSLDKLLDDMEVAKEWYTWDSAIGEEEKVHPLTRDERITRLKWLLGGQYSWGKWDVNIKELPNWKVEVLRSKNNILKEEYANAKQAMAEFAASKTESAKYHYQGIIQNMKKPLVVDLWKKKYWLKDWKTWEEFDTGRWWNDLWTAYELLERENSKWLKNLEKVSKKFNDTFWKTSKERRDFMAKTSELRWDYSKKYDEYWEKVRWQIDDSNRETIYGLDRDVQNSLNASIEINQYLNLERDKINPEILDWIKQHDDFNKVYNEVLDFVDKNRDYLEYLSSAWYVKKDITEWLIKNWMDKDVASLMHGFRLSGETDIVELLKGKDLETNDYVFYALRNWNYDWVIFKDILDFGSNDAFDKAANKGWDVLVAFNSKQFKAWDNANPTDSKYISYKKDTWLAKKELPATDNDGRKLSEAQRRFFAGTKVVDKNGNLLTVYHGTQAGDFTIYQKGKNNVSNSLAKVGYWFTPNKEWALNFAKDSYRWNSAPRADEVYLDIKNPKVYEPSKFNLLDNKEKEVARDNQRKVYNEKADKADALDYTKAGWFFHDEFDHPYYERQIFQDLKRSWENDRKYEWKYWKYDPEQYRKLAEEFNRNYDAKLDYDKILKDFEEYTKATLDAEKEHNKYLDMKYDDPYEDFQYDIYKLDSTLDKKWTKGDLMMALNDYNSPEKLVEKLKSEWYDGIIIKWTEYDGNIIWWWARNDQYVAFDSNQIKRVTNLNPTNNPDIRFKKWYHWSPAKFDRFDSTHMWEGEGAQAHWWGHYIALDKKTAEKYAISRNSEYKGIPIEDFFKTKEWKVYSNIEKEAIRKVGEYIPTYTPEEAIEVLQDDLYPPKSAYDRAVINAIKNLDPSDFNSGRHLYDVDFKDPARKNTPSGWNYLDEETPYSRKTFDKIFEEAKKQGWDESKAQNYIDDKLKFNGNDKMYGVWIRQALDMWFGEESWKKTSKFLESLGYDWIHYNWLQDGEAYVLFGDDTGKITNHVAFKKDVKGLGKKQDNDSWLRYKKARHGSQADFDKFDSSHMWEWEGHQAHWWGHYSAVSPKVAKQNYAEMGAIKYRWKQVGWYSNLASDIDELWLSTDEVNMVRSIAQDMQENWVTSAEAKSKLLKKWEGYLEKDKERVEKAKKRGDEKDIEAVQFLADRNQKLIDTIKSIDENDFNKRHLYELDIPDEKKVDTPTGTNYLEEKGLMGALAVQDFVDAFRKKYPEKADQFEATVWSNTAPRHWEAEWWEIYTYLEDALWSPKAASKFLEEMGYDGIHYVGRRDWDAYVVFKDENMDIKNHIRYKKDANWLTKKDYSDNWLRYKKAWHWSPADFDRFDSSHMGEWEWAQAHGWGHYVAVNKKTWEYYAQGKWEYKYNWDKTKDKWWKTEVMVNRIIDDINNYWWTPKEAIEATRKWYEAQMKWASEAMRKNIKEELDTLNKIDADNFKFNGDKHLYEVDVPDPVKRDTPTGNNYLEEAKYYSKDEVKKFLDKINEIDKKWMKDTKESRIYNDLYNKWLDISGKDLYNMLAYAKWDKEASKLLESLWYDGIHYYGGRDGEAYVIFSDDKPQITRKLYKKDVKWLQKKESWLQKKDNGIRYKLDSKWFTPTRVLTSDDFDEMKTRGTSMLKTYDKITWEDTLRRAKQQIRSDLWTDIKDGARIRKSDITHTYNNHAYDTELWYGKSVTKQDFAKIPEILENYDKLINTRDANWNPTNIYTFQKDYGNDRYNLVMEVFDLRDWGKQLSLKTFFINNPQWRTNFLADKRRWLVKERRKNARLQYGSRINL